MQSRVLWGGGLLPLLLLLQAFSDDWEEAAPIPPTRQQAEADGSGEADEQPVNDVVRPGRFMSTLHAMWSEIERGEGDAHPGLQQRQALVRRLQDIQMEAMAVLDHVQRA